MKYIILQLQPIFRLRFNFNVIEQLFVSANLILNSNTLTLKLRTAIFKQQKGTNKYLIGNKNEQNGIL